MADLSKEQVASELNTLSQQGATEQQLADFVAKSGYTETDFNIDLGGTFRPMVTDTSPASLPPPTADATQSEQYYESLTSSASVEQNPNVQTTTATFEQSTGGGSTTVYSLPAKDTTASLSYQQNADQAFQLQQAYQLNPDSSFGKRALDRKLANGEITQAQYNEITSSTPEQRFAKANEYSAQYQDLRQKAENAKEPVPPVVETTTSPANPNIEVTGQAAVTENSTSIPTNDPAQEGIGEEDDGLGAPIETPPAADEFEGVDTAVEANENGLQEPPVLSDEEVDAYLSDQPTDEEGPPLAEPPVPDEPVQPDEFAGVDEQVQSNAEADAELQRESRRGGPRGLQGDISRTRQQATAQDLYNYQAMKDWRVKLKLAPDANYLYKASPNGILAPLAQTDGVVFPYTPQISVNYIANYIPTDLTHSNYKIYQYQNSAVDNFTITCDFTAQDTYEANYVLAVIHFFKSITKMFYGKDQDPVNGTPPPLCFIEGYGQYQFNGQPMAITSFNYQLPQDVDYIRATADMSYNLQSAPSGQSQQSRSVSSGIGPGGSPLPTKFNGLPVGSTPTYVPTKIQIQVAAIPIVSRADVSQTFSLKDFATGRLVRGDLRAGKGGGFW